MVYEHKTLFLDIETTGLPIRMVPGKKPGTMKKYQFNYATEYMNFPYIVSMAWAINDGESVYYVFNQEGREIPQDATDIHGITTEEANKSDTFLFDGITNLINDSKDSEIVVGHGLYFDTSIIKANVLRLFHNKDMGELTYDKITEILHKHKRFDTMRRTAKMGGKWLTLSELHQKIFNKGFDCHDAKADVEATRRCYEWLVKKEKIS